MTWLQRRYQEWWNEGVAGARSDDWAGARAHKAGVSEDKGSLPMGSHRKTVSRECGR